MAEKKTIKIGTRGSRLALAQSRLVLAILSRQFPAVTFELKVIKTQGDKLLDFPLAQIGGKGLFVKEIETALLGKKIDLAVHSLKDLPTETPGGLVIGAIPKREEARDMFVTSQQSLATRVKRIGTSSLRRRAQLLAWRKNWEVVDLRGNLDTRIRKLLAGEIDAIVVAGAGVKRLRIKNEGLRMKLLPFKVMLPAPGQGALAIECRGGDDFALSLLKRLNHRPTELAVTAERALLFHLGGGCLVPIGAYAKINGGKMKLAGIVADTKGEKVVNGTEFGDKNNPETIGQKLAKKLLKMGAGRILRKEKAY